jgi:hypothetical protein
MLHKHLISREECFWIEKTFFEILSSGKSDEDDGFCENSHGFLLPIDVFRRFPNIDSDGIINRITQIIQNNYPDTVLFSHIYIRSYYNNSILPLHTDKNGLDITLSVNIGGIEDWVMNISNFKSRFEFNEKHPLDANSKNIDIFKSKFASFVTEKGCGCSCYGAIYPHWRDKLVCRDDEYVLQMFFHWKILNKIEELQ